MTSNPITIAGETLEAEDWPESCPSFVRNSGGGFSFVTAWEDDDAIADHVPVQQLNAMELKHAAAVARCWFLDKAADEQKTMDGYWFAGQVLFAFLDLYRQASGRREAYLASADKWARIAKNKL